ncbi:MAG TPA: tripartite tricarboxylate transporter substrate binding protein [Burkholderiales bacterium]|nr:tripartite tricarboxylate transporter substrate binding protein [Burkholderiales bacterium]
MKKDRVGIFAGALLALAAGHAQAQQYPQRPVSLVVPFPPGAATDAFARIVAERMTKVLGQQIVVINRDGAAGLIGTDFVVRSAPDGYTLVWGTSSGLAIMPALGRKMPFEPQRDLAPVSLGAKLAYVLVVHPSLPVKTVKELIAFAKTRPGKLNFASAGVGGAPHLSGELFKTMAGIDIVHVPYRGTALFATDLVAGQVEMAFASPVTTLPFTNNGRLRALAVTTTTRVDAYPGLPTMAEAGLPGYELTQWYALLAPAKTPTEVINILNGAIRKALEDPNVRTRITSEGGVPSPTSPEGLAEFIRAETAKYRKIAAAAKLKMDQ